MPPVACFRLEMSKECTGSICCIHNKIKRDERSEWSRRGALAPLGSLEQVLHFAGNRTLICTEADKEGASERGLE